MRVGVAMATNGPGVTLPITKHNSLVTSADELAFSIREAIFIARTGRPAFNARRNAEHRHQIEEVGKKLQGMMPFLEAKSVPW